MPPSPPLLSPWDSRNKRWECQGALETSCQLFMPSTKRRRLDWGAAGLQPSWRGRENEKNKEMEDEASGTRGTQRHTNPRHPQPSFSLMIPVADCFIEKRESSLGKSFYRLSVYRSIFLPSILFRDCLFIYLFIFSYVSDSEEV